jgi:hypothetical protein
MPSWWKRKPRENSERCVADAVLVESVVLAYVVGECPQGVTIPTLAVRFNAEFDQGIGGLAVERAVRELVCAGRLQMQGGRVVPDRSAWELAA